MLSVGPGAPRFSSSQDIRMILSLPRIGNVHYRQHNPKLLRIRARRQGGRRRWPLQQDRIPAAEDESRHQKVRRNRPCAKSTHRISWRRSAKASW